MFFLFYFGESYFLLAPCKCSNLAKDLLLTRDFLESSFYQIVGAAGFIESIFLKTLTNMLGLGFQEVFQ